MTAITVTAEEQMQMEADAFPHIDDLDGAELLVEETGDFSVSSHGQAELMQRTILLLC